MNELRTITALAGAALLGGCSLLTVGYDVENLREATPVGSEFTKALTEEYLEFTNFETDEMYDWLDASHFARKGLRAASGEVVQPEAIADWKLPADKVGELTAARADLVGLLDANARDNFPDLAGHAQGRFDCWIEQQEENHQPEHIAACRDAFYATLEKLRAAMAPKPAAQPAPAPAPEPMPMEAPKPFMVYFGFDSAEVTAASRQTIDDAVATAKKIDAKLFSVTGHADRAGPEEYNLGLSLRRANAVREVLVGRGIDPASVSIAGRGEAEPAVPTADGVKEPANRRVEIIVLQ